MANEEIRLRFNKRRVAGLTGNQLKAIAFLFMLCDSVGSMLIENGMLYAQNPVYWSLALETTEGRRLYLIARVLRMIGRLAFPIFAFLISEGVAHTKNILKYVLRLFIFACLSEVPFDLATRGVIYYDEYQNILFTFVLGALAIAIVKRFAKLHLIIKILIIAVFCLISYLVKSDYGPMGVLMISTFYMLKEEYPVKFVVGAIVAATESVNYACVSAISLILIYFYNGRRGTMPIKYFFYIAYPAHMLLFWALVFFFN